MSTQDLKVDLHSHLYFSLVRSGGFWRNICNRIFGCIEIARISIPSAYEQAGTVAGACEEGSTA